MRVGTNHFVSRESAVRYYRDAYANNAEQAVQDKLAAGEIVIGKPLVGPGNTLFVIPGEGRYGIESA